MHTNPTQLDIDMAEAMADSEYLEQREQEALSQWLAEYERQLPCTPICTSPCTRN